MTADTPVSALRMFGRALTLRCPRCGGRGLFVSWFAMKERALMIGAPFLLFPLSRTEWLAFDQLFRPGHESHYR